MEEEKEKKCSLKKIIIIIVSALIVIGTIITIIIIVNHDDMDFDYSDRTSQKRVEKDDDEEKEKDISEDIIDSIKYYIKESDTNDFKITKNDNEKYDIEFTYKKNIMYLHVCAADSQSFIKKIIKVNINNKDLINSIKMNCYENNQGKYIVIVNNFPNLTEENLESNTILLDSNGNNINKTVSQTMQDFINEYKNSCKTYDYKTIFRYAEDYKGKDVKYTGKVVQVIENDSYTSYRVNVTKDRWGYYDDTIYVTFMNLDKSTPRILEDDIITFYGTLSDLYTYETIMGGTVTIPSVVARYIDLKK